MAATAEIWDIRLLEDFKRARGVIKLEYEDFVVDEVPLYDFSGQGSHTYVLIEKAGLSTVQAIHDLASALNVKRRDIGYAGLKDARAVTRQWISIEHAPPDLVRKLDIPRIRVLEVTSHTNKLRTGHLAGNRFRIRVRHTDPDRLAELQDALATLCRRGVPNHFGPQRFGGRGDTWLIGRALVQNQPEDAVDLILGRPGPRDHGDILRARRSYDEGRYRDAARRWPGMFRDERRALKALAESNNKRRALASIDKTTRRLYVSAYQSCLFNRVVAMRLATGLDQVWPGDLAWLHGSGAVFRVEDAAVEQPRADSFEISPSGPLFGYRMTAPGGRAGEMEQQILAGEGATLDSFSAGPIGAKGGRRPLRFAPREASVRLAADSGGPYLELGFFLPRGCYATAVLNELFDLAPQRDRPEEEEEEPGTERGQGQG
ncbi:tRNA pseudouridine synthase D [Phycisphaerae bacterium RAS1]|nr:tRNA pseudouridine synthase D [Phycisphaerae bacterium RAS1]